MDLSEVELARLGDRSWNRSDFVKELRARLSEAGLKFCPPCAQVLPIEDFHGRGYCNPCIADRSREYYSKNREAVAERRSLYRRINKEFIADDGPEPVPDLLADDFEDDFDER